MFVIFTLQFCSKTGLHKKKVFGFLSNKSKCSEISYANVSYRYTHFSDQSVLYIGTTIFLVYCLPLRNKQKKGNKSSPF